MSQIIYTDYTGCEFDPPLEIDEIPQTHYDEIKAMSVEELAKLFVSGWYDGPLFACPVKDDGCESDIPCDVCFLNWLKSPAGDGET